MNETPLQLGESLHIGTVDFVSPDQVKVLLDVDAPDSIAINTGLPRPFPRINGYVLVPSDDGFLVGQVEWITIEHSPYPKRKGMQDFGLVDLPFPLRKVSLNPLGTLTGEGQNREGRQTFRFRRGVDAFPSVGDPVLLPTNSQLISIIESGEKRRVKIGTSPLAESAQVKIDPDRLFGRHLAVLGNTGSGKSCSVAGIIRWSLELAQKAGRDHTEPNARFIVLDPNGEYSRAFQDFENARIFSVEPNDQGKSLQLQVPLWFWNSAEWCAFTQASGKTQRPLLRRALREIRTGQPLGQGVASAEAKVLKLRRYLSAKVVKLQNDLHRDLIKQEETKFGYYLAAVAADLSTKLCDFDDLKQEIAEVISCIQNACKEAFKSFEKNGETIEYYRAFQEKTVQAIIESIEKLLLKIGGVIYQEGPDEDCPLNFAGASLADHVEQLGIEENASQFIDFLVMRIRTLLADTRMKSVIGEPAHITLEEWLRDYIGDDKAANGTVTIIDLSLAPSEVVHILTSVIARMTFEALQRYRRMHPEHKVLPTVLVMEEAHTFVRRYNEDAENFDAAATCCQLFERIAREGRKFGLGLVLSSQRPSELSPTVLSQCNTFLLHRISNDRDQELVRKLVPDNLKGLLRDLPSLPSQMAILLGWASELPVLVRMSDLPKEQQPRSDDPDFWDVWIGDSERSIGWQQLADQWQQKGSSQAQVPTEEKSSADESEDDVPF